MGCRSSSAVLGYLQAQLRAPRSILLLMFTHCQSLDALSAPVAQVLEIYIKMPPSLNLVKIVASMVVV